MQGLMFCSHRFDSFGLPAENAAIKRVSPLQMDPAEYR
jgi:leucyl-tRNA synthetase